MIFLDCPAYIDASSNSTLPRRSSSPARPALAGARANSPTDARA